MPTHDMVSYLSTEIESHQSQCGSEVKLQINEEHRGRASKLIGAKYIHDESKNLM
jgi:hypothetical protein